MIIYDADTFSMRSSKHLQVASNINAVLVICKQFDYFSGMKKIIRRSKCPISSALDILGDKWAFLIIRDMMFKGKKTYSEFIDSGEKIATNILADRLLTLEKEGIIEKKSFPGNKVKILYELTQKGIDLMPILFELVLWGDKYFEISEKGKWLAGKIREDKESLKTMFLEKLKS